MPADTALMEKLTALCKRRGFIFQSSEIYGGIGGFWDYGPLGVELKRNIKNQWWRDMILNPPIGPDGLGGGELQMVGVDCSIIMNPKVWEASGHVGGFSDPMVDCKETKHRYRADQIMVLRSVSDSGAGQMFAFAKGDEESEARIRKVASKYFKTDDPAALAVVALLDVPVSDYPRIVAPDTKTVGTLTEPRAFNLMFQTYVGALQDSSSVAYLRPETAQGIFANYKNVLDTQRVKLPFGIGQVGKAFRNEINPRNYTFRSREFEQMEIEFFCRDEDSMQWYEFWRNTRYNWYTNLGLKSEKLRLRDQTAEELAHYSRACADIEYLFPFSDDFQELEGVAHRGCFDLTQHETHSGRDLHYFDDDLWQRDAANYKDNKEAATKAKQGEPYRFLPTVIEPSAGADRATLAFLCEAYVEEEVPSDKGKAETRTVMRFHPKLAPFKAAFFPLVSKEGMPEIAEQMYRDAKKHLNVFFDDKGAIGRRYRRQDEAGTPFCITVDGDTLSQGTVTIRDRDSLEQVRVGKEHVVGWLKERLGE